MKVLLKVAAAGSFSAAARSLGISPSMAAKHVDAVEDRLGARLFFRSTRKLTLTDAGQRYVDAVDRILGEIDEAEAMAAAEVAEPRGTLRLNAPLAFGLRHVMPALADFAKAYPSLVVEVGLTDRMVDLVEEGWDVAVRIGTLRDSSLHARHIAPVHLSVCASPAYLALHGTPKTVAELMQHTCLGYTLPTAATAGRWPFGTDGKTTVNVRGTLMVNNGDALRIAALAGQGIIYQPTFITGDDIRAGRLVPIQLDQPAFWSGGIHAVYASGRRLPAKVRVFVDFVTKRWAGAPWDAGLHLGPK